MIEVQHLTKRYGSSVAVDDLSFTVAAGRVTGFLGPNGSGKSTTMRAIVGLDRPTEGTVRVNGRRYIDFPAPLREVGALLDAKNVHPGRSAYDHLLYLARSNGIGKRRVDEVLGARRAGDRRPQARQDVLARHGPAARHRCCAARRSGDAHLRRARQRPRPAGHRLAPHHAQVVRRRRTCGARLQPPHLRDGTSRRPSGGHRARQAHRRQRRRRLPALSLRRHRADPHRQPGRRSAAR